MKLFPAHLQDRFDQFQQIEIHYSDYWTPRQLHRDGKFWRLVGTIHGQPWYREVSDKPEPVTLLPVAFISPLGLVVGTADLPVDGRIPHTIPSPHGLAQFQTLTGTEGRVAYVVPHPQP